MTTYPKVDYHIHSYQSGCSSRSMTVKRIVRAAENRGFEAIAITDHIDFPEDKIRFQIIAEDLEKLRPNIKVMLGCELEATRPDVPLTKEDVTGLDIVMVGTTHRHSLPPNEEPDKSPESLARATEKALAKAVEFDWGHTIAHPLVFFEGRGGLAEALEIIGESRLREIMTTAAKNSIAFEISPRTFGSGPIQPIADFYRICIDCGGKISIGSDAHDLDGVCALGLTYTILRQAEITDSDILII